MNGAPQATPMRGKCRFWPPTLKAQRAASDCPAFGEPAGCHKRKDVKMASEDLSDFKGNHEGDRSVFEMVPHRLRCQPA